MSEIKPVSITILDKEYLVSCSDEEREKLYQAAEFLNERLAQTKASGKIIGSERIAVMTALNITHELIAHKEKNLAYTSQLDNTIERLHEKIHNALDKGRQIETPVS